MTTPAKKAKKKWDSKNLESMNIKLRKGLRDQYKLYAEKSGLPLAEFVRQAIEEKAERENLSE